MRRLKIKVKVATWFISILVGKEVLTQKIEYSASAKISEVEKFMADQHMISNDAKIVMIKKLDVEEKEILLSDQEIIDYINQKYD